MGPKRNFKYAGLHLPPKHFDSLREYEHKAMRLKGKGLSHAEIAAELKIKEGTLTSYFAEIRSGIKSCTGVQFKVKRVDQIILTFP